jgi:nicotinate-nucleotide adenylyltransferase
MAPDLARVGVYGGTFDPVHRGHLAVAQSVREAFNLHSVLFIPARQSPLRAPPLAPARDRLTMVDRAIVGMPGFESSSIDIDRPGPSYMIDTLRILASQRPAVEFFLILGADAIGELPAWRHADQILAAARIIAVPRPGHATEIPANVLALHPQAETRIHVHCMGLVDVAASRIRAQCARGRSIDAWVPEPVAQYIAARELYAGSEREPPRAI